jgi:hypothetical protein
MKSSLRLAGAAVLCASLLLTACAKSHETSTSTSTDATKTTDTSIAATPGAGTSAPDATAASDATAAPADASTTVPAATAGATTATAAATTAAAGSSGGAGITFIEIPVYPGAAELKDQSVSMSANGSSVAIKAYSTKDDTKRVIDWYKSHLPASWKNFQLSSGDKTTGSFSNEGTDGDQTVLIATQDDKTTRVQLSTKHGK